jgi:hypothetical protein
VVDEGDRSEDEYLAAMQEAFGSWSRGEDGEAWVERLRSGRRLSGEATLGAESISLAERLRGPFPWIEFLSPAERATFASELVDVARACAGVGNFEQVAFVLGGWHDTATAYAEGIARDGADLTYLDATETVADPRR